MSAKRPKVVGEAEPAVPLDEATEWLETDGLGGYSMGTTALTRTRRYHALLVHALVPPAERVVLVNGFDAWIETAHGRFAVSSQRYAPDALAPDGAARVESFTCEPWPRWTFALEDGTRVEQELVRVRGTTLAVVSWRRVAGTGRATLVVRPFLSGRDHHALQRENDAPQLSAIVLGERVDWHTYAHLPAVASLANAEYVHRSFWYRDFLYAEERARGHDCVEDLASPGELRFDLGAGEAHWLVGTAPALDAVQRESKSAREAAQKLRERERRRRAAFPTRLARSADDFFVRRGTGLSIVAGYPWFTDWGRDTFIALRGLALATGRFDDARAILVEWSKTVSLGMVPNRFPDRGQTPDYNSVDASLWYCVAVGEFLDAVDRGEAKLARADRAALADAVLAIVDGYARGTRFSIGCDDDGLVTAGVEGVQLTWMDAKVDGRVITPRRGKPVEIQALWIHTLAVAERFTHARDGLRSKAEASFVRRFWNPTRRALFDVVDVDGRSGVDDATLRPNQALALGGLPRTLLDAERARIVVETLERELWTPLGMRTLAPCEPEYRGRYEGGPVQRDETYHQGTAWPWLAGAFVEAWLRVHDSTDDAKREARERFLAPLHAHTHRAGLGHVSEIVDGEVPHTPRGAPFQAWSLGELLRLDRLLA
ncbi:MAG: glycogen debranching enzyme family protein [Planctomycetes bacterium]|nr:glycogen debranching enzyme family protein [Planctomycetota bacterium]